MLVNDTNLCPTAILDYLSQPVQMVRRRLQVVTQLPLDYLQSCHGYLRTEVLPIYTVDELQPVSVTLAKRKGSCSQRFACLEALARAAGIPTRVRGMWIAGRFWAARFRWTHAFIPRRILLALPQFYVNDDWLDVEELFGTIPNLAERNPNGFSNDAESLFDAITHVAIDFRGKAVGCGGAGCNLSRFAIDDAGTFASRDELFSANRLLQKTFRGRVFEFIYGGRKSC